MQANPTINHDHTSLRDNTNRISASLPENDGQISQQAAMTIWLTGLSGSGKSTLANALAAYLKGMKNQVFVLDGDDLRAGLSNNLGFSAEDRHENIRRAAEVAKLMNQAGLIVISALISPFQQDRSLARNIIGPHRFIEIHVSTELAVCERRDPKGLYKKARAGLLGDFTGISSPYEIPVAPATRIDTNTMNMDHAIREVMNILNKSI